MLRKGREDLWGPVINIKVNGLKSLLGVVWEGRGPKDCGFGSMST